jgi:hypothetical protein
VLQLSCQCVIASSCVVVWSWSLVGGARGKAVSVEILAASAAMALALHSEQRPLPGGTQPTEIVRDWCMSRMLTVVWVKLVSEWSASHLLLRRSRHWDRRSGSEVYILMCQMCLCLWRVAVARDVVRESVSTAASLADAFGPSVSVRTPTVLPLRLAAQDAMAMGTPSWLLGHLLWQKSWSLSGLLFDSSVAIVWAQSFLSSPRGRLESIAKQSEGMACLTHGPCLKLCASHDLCRASLASLVSTIKGGR